MTIARPAIVAALSALALTVNPGSADTTVSISLNEFSITASPGSAQAGAVNFQVTNLGQTFHSFLVAATNLPADQLPMDKQTNTVIEGQLNVVANTGDIQVGQSTSVSPTLAPGNYVLFCNIPGHYNAGQYLAFQVTAAVTPTATTTPEETPSNNGADGRRTDGRRADGRTAQYGRGCAGIVAHPVAADDRIGSCGSGTGLTRPGAQAASSVT